MAQSDDGQNSDSSPASDLTQKINCALIVEDEFIIAEAMRTQLERFGVPVCGIAATAREAIDLAVAHGPRLVLMDVRLKGDDDGVDAALAIHAKVGSKVIFITGSREQATIDRIQLDHAAATLFKPISAFQLKRTIETVMG